jgi:cytochrome c-type protein NapB
VIYRRLVIIGFIALAMLVLVLWLGGILTERRAALTYPPPRSPLAAGDPIASETQVFRLKPGDVAVDTTALRRPAAHRRTLAMYRAIRAYPGAPPRIPHGLTNEEYRTGRCNACHERGGYVERFAAYAPVTPHPEYAACLQCHVAEATIVGISFPDPGRDGLCLQCHTRGDPRPSFSMANWRPLAWPSVGQSALDGSPPLIPHDFELRGNCLACHLGPSAVEELRTSHPERANCRQCHVSANAMEEVYTRPANATVPSPGSGS